MNADARSMSSDEEDEGSDGLSTRAQQMRAHAQALVNLEQERQQRKMIRMQKCRVKAVLYQAEEMKQQVRRSLLNSTDLTLIDGRSSCFYMNSVDMANSDDVL